MEDDEVKNLVKDTIHANGIDIGIYTQDFENEFISLTDIARYKSDEPKDVIKNWISWFRASALQAEGRRFESVSAHQVKRSFNNH